MDNEENFIKIEIEDISEFPFGKNYLLLLLLFTIY